MMIDYNVSDHWSESDPTWLRSLVSSLDRRHGSSSLLPLTVILEEVLEWVAVASGTDAWRKRANRESLELDIDQSRAAIGPNLSAVITADYVDFKAAFTRLIASPNSLLEQPPGLRADAAWTDVETSATTLLATLDFDAAVGASWDDLVAVAQDRTLEHREYRPISELLWDQLRRRKVGADSVFRALVYMTAFSLGPDDLPVDEKYLPIDERITSAREIAATPPSIEPTVVWLGYLGRGFPTLSAGSVTFMSAHWAVPNATMTDGQDFEHKVELAELVEHGILFKVARLVDEESDVDFLVRVDLGPTTADGAVERATSVVNTILNVSIHNAGGSRPQLAQYGVLRSGKTAGSSFMVSPRDAGFQNDNYGAEITAEAIDEHGPRIAEALAKNELPRFLAAALEVQTTADHPFSRDMGLRKPSEADISSVIPLADRVVQHIASYAAIGPDTAFDLLGARWAHARWLNDIQRAVHMCLLGGSENRDLQDELTREWFARNPKRPWIVFVADRAVDFLSLCRIESERAWIARIFASISDDSIYRALTADYAAEAVTLEARRRRVRNALVHGNPASFPVVNSVREFAGFLGGSALQLGLEAFVSGTAPATALGQRTAEYAAMRTGVSAVDYRRARRDSDGRR